MYEPGDIGMSVFLMNGWMRYTDAGFININFPSQTELFLEARVRPDTDDRAFVFWKESLCAGWSFSIVNQKYHPTFTNTPLDCEDNSFRDINLGDVDTTNHSTVAVHWNLVNETMKFWLDGAFLGSTEIESDGITAGRSPFRIGTDWQEELNFTGEIDELHISRNEPTSAAVAFRHLSFSGTAGTYGEREVLTQSDIGP